MPAHAPCSRRLLVEAPMQIEILFIAGCPNHSPSLDRLRKVLREEGVSAELSEIEVKDSAAARALNFIGSPTIRVNGLDIEVESRTVNEPAFACRRYAGGAPSDGMIRSALREALTAVKDA